MAKILAFLPNSFTSNFVVVLDEIQQAINNKNEVIIVGCEGSINHCEMNLSGSKYICKSCSHCLKHSLKLLKGNYKYYSLNSFCKKEEIITDIPVKEINTVNSIKELKTLKYKEFDVGYAVASTYISITRNQNPLFSKDLKRFISYLYNDSIYIYNGSKVAIETLQPEKIIIFNGRLHVNRPLVSLAEKFKIAIDILEVIGGKGNKPYEKVRFENYLPHSIENNTTLINKNWENGDSEKEEKGREFFEYRKKGIVAGDRVYIGEQLKGLLPTGFDTQKKNIAVFISSDDEMAAIGKEWEWNFLGGDQLSAINIILSLMESYKDYFFYIRVHPNLKNITYKYHTDYYSLENKHDNVNVISADSQISSYALLDSCDKIITFGSSIGIEATYWRKPSILIGRTIYMNLDVTYNPTDEKSLVELLKDNNLAAKPFYNTLKYGYFVYGRKGEEFHCFDPNNLIQKPTWLNRNALLLNITPYRKFTINSFYNFLRFSISRLLNHLVLNKNIPTEETK